MPKLSDEFLQATIDVWQPYSTEEVTLEDARQLTENMTGFMTVLAEWEADTEHETMRQQPSPFDSSVDES